MLQSLLEDRFKLTLHETKEVSTFTLVVAKGGPKLQKSTADPGRIRFGGGQIVAQRVTMTAFAQAMAGMLGGDTSDKTGHTGFYDLTLIRPDDAVDSAWILTAVQDFGLKFESQKAPIEFNFIDHAEKPSTN